jgi:LuxR family maltose regulon positive regulatory protein
VQVTAGGGSNPATVTTIKTHIQHIYAKLGTHRRAEAVERARSLGLLARSARKPT